MVIRLHSRRSDDLCQIIIDESCEFSRVTTDSCNATEETVCPRNRLNHFRRAVDFHFRARFKTPRNHLSETFLSVHFFFRCHVGVTPANRMKRNRENSRALRLRNL